MSGKELRRAWILTKWLVGELNVAEAAQLIGLSQRQMSRLKTAFERDDPATQASRVGSRAVWQWQPGRHQALLPLEPLHLADQIVEHRFGYATHRNG